MRRGRGLARTQGFNPRTHTGCDHNTSPASRPCPPCFNPRTHTGCDFPPYGVGVLGDGVSIHAPTRGATRRPAPWRQAPNRFNPRTHTGCDPTTARILRFNDKFQSTHPHGVRQTGLSGAVTSFLFQSTHPHGVRPIWN